MLPIIGRLFPSDSPEKWKAIESAAQSKARTDRMIKMIKASARMQVTSLGLVLAAVVVIVVAIVAMRYMVR